MSGPAIRAYMKMIVDPDYGLAMAFVVANSQRDRLTAGLRRKYIWAKWDDAALCWIVHENQIAETQELLEELFGIPEWDPMIARDLECMPVPSDTQYPIRSVRREHFEVLRLPISASCEQVRDAYRRAKEQYYEGKIPEAVLRRCQDAMERILRADAEYEERYGAATSEEVADDTWSSDGGEARARRAIEELERRLRSQGR